VVLEGGSLNIVGNLLPVYYGFASLSSVLLERTELTIGSVGIYFGVWAMILRFP